MCAICDGATEDEVRQHLAESIDWYGWSVQGVEASPANWGWAYTVGLSERFGHPELVVACMLDFSRCGALLNVLGDQIQVGRRFRAGDRTTVANTDVAFATVHPHQFDHGVFDMWFDHYRAFPDHPGGLTALQVVLPPAYFCAHTGPQPRLDQPGLALERRAGNRAVRRGERRAGRRATGRRRPPPSGRR